MMAVSLGKRFCLANGMDVLAKGEMNDYRQQAMETLVRPLVVDAANA